MRKRIAVAAEIAAQRPRGQLIAPRRATEPEVDPARIKRVQGAKLFRDHEGGMVRQHDPARADPDAFRAAGDMSDYDGGRSAGNAGKIVMFRQPVAVVAPFLSVPREIERVAKSERCVAAFDDRREIEQGKIFHGRCTLRLLPAASRFACAPYPSYKTYGSHMTYSMEYTRLGKSGLKVSRLCLGCMTYGVPERGGHPWCLNEEQSRPFIARALELGINFFDTANAYSDGTSEEIVGRALREMGQRDELVVATKVFFPWRDRPNTGGLSRKAIMTAIDASLRRLGMEYVDLYQIHRWDYDVPIEETLEALHDVVQAGKARYIGASSMYSWQFCQALYLADQHGWTRFVSMQPHYNLLYREEEREMLPLCEEEGIGVIPWSPLARGRLARPWGDGGGGRAARDDYGKTLYRQTEASDRVVVERLNELAAAKQLPPAQIALAWLLHKSAVTAPIVGASKLHHLDDAVAALALELSPNEIAALEEPYHPHPVLGFS